ncbi:glycerol-3-phosphate dehydrogenase [uncultured Bradyrhizobium sp.]|uniref:glycerol-3-phosphate dehydrogenase n=1 Tax=uncultured Bradyrhizobium sp. TaxID=199684 RepID=UPI00260C976D|nr:glycerol-3-phosphate dehydrogenase [uncultured Bradyrhizobium sp.]
MIAAAPGADHGLVDIAIIGGGINGAGIARDAAGRGLKVLLCEKGDFAEGTSSRSGKLVHGGLRYLEYYEFRLVREALIEREVLLASAPHIIWPMRFVLPHSPEQRPAWLIRSGLFLYDHLGGRKQLPASRGLDLSRAPEGKPLREEYRRGFEYSDCWVDDARLVILNLIDAARSGAVILPRTSAVSARREQGAWRLEMQGVGGPQVVRARALVNAAGPWVSDVVQGVVGLNSSHNVRLVKGSHIVVPKFWSGPQAYLLQNEDRRVIFVNPYEDSLALIGTTDIPYDGRAEDVVIDADETAYLLGILRRYFRASPGQHDIVHAFSGVRPLYDDNSDNPSAVTRDYVFEVHGTPEEPPLLTIYGGKITTYRRLAEHALGRLAPWFHKMSPAWTAGKPLPGGDIGGTFEGFATELARAYPDLPGTLTHHYARLYGTRARDLLGSARSVIDLGRHFGGDFYECEADFLRATEWAEEPADFLERRTKHGLHLTRAQRDAFEAHL